MFETIKLERQRDSRGLRTGAVVTLILGLSLGAWLGSATPSRFGMDDRIAAATLACPPGMWSEPRVVSELPPGTFLRTPSFTVGPETFLLTGVPSPASAQAATIILRGDPILKSETGETIGRPPGDFELINARLLTGPDGLQHLIWGERSPTSAARSRPEAAPTIRVHSLWHATYGRRTGWSTPRPLYDPLPGRDELLWNFENAGASISAEGAIALVVPRIGHSLHYAAYEDGLWRTDAISVKATYADIAHGDDGAVYLAVVGEDQTQKHGQNGRLLFLRSADSGRSWTSPKWLRAGRNVRASRPRLSVSHGKIVHLFWGQHISADVTTDVVRHIASDDEGRTWTRPHDLNLPALAFTKWQSGVDACGVPRVVTSTWVPQGSTHVGRVFHAALRGHWHDLGRVLPHNPAREVRLRSGSDGTLHLIASVRRSPAGDRLPSYEAVAAALQSGSRSSW